MRKTLLLFSLAAIVFTGCVQYEDVTFRGVRGVQLRSMNGGSMALTIEAEVENPNGYRIKLKDPDVDLWYNGQLLGKARLDSAVVLQPRSTLIYPVHVSADTKGQLGPLLLGGLGSLFTGTATVRAAGTVKGQVGIIGRRFPFDISDTLNLR